MENKKIESLLTSTAKSTLDEYLKEVREDILHKAMIEARANDEESKEIRMTEIINALKETSYIPEIQKKLYAKSQFIQSNRSRKLGLAMLVGITYSFLGFTYYFIKNRELNLETDLGLIAGILGLFITLITFLYGFLLKDRAIRKEIQHKSNSNYGGNKEFELLNKWKIIENQFRSIVEFTSDKNSNTFSISNLIRYAHDKDILSPNDEKEIRKVLAARNEIVHGHGKVKLSDKELNELIEYATQLISKIETKLK